VLIGQVEHMGHECDLALLSVPDDSFWAGLPSLEFGNLPVCVVLYWCGMTRLAVHGNVRGTVFVLVRFWAFESSK
jgi:hypothetical protein